MTERQQTLEGEVITTKGYAIKDCGISLNHISERAKVLLRIFYSNLNNPVGLSHLDIAKKWTGAHENTIRNTFHTLIKHEYIRLRYKNVGWNKRIKTYVITEKGVQAWEAYAQAMGI